jgi:hypothetical protein
MQPDKYGRVSPRWREHETPLKLNVSKQLVPRALRYFDTLIKTVELLGGEIAAIDCKWEYYTKITLCGENIGRLRLFERSTKDKEQRKHSYSRSYHEQTFTPTGFLTLDTGEEYTSNIYCQDTKKGRRIEDHINSTVIRMIKKAGQTRIKRKKEAAAHEIRQEEARKRREHIENITRQREELQQKQIREQKLVQTLMEDAMAWQQARTLRDYIDAVEAFTTQQKEHMLNHEETLESIKWARAQADRLDPLIQGPPSILDQALPDIPLER